MDAHQDQALKRAVTMGQYDRDMLLPAIVIL